mmetsp:Transcript_68785/g.199564  ORF Transcript_68785/g.199564 Transcript_68785/m.199564 type:complete len:238 (+) Transcript_68785:530-1243(+)
MSSKPPVAEIPGGIFPPSLRPVVASYTSWSSCTRCRARLGRASTSKSALGLAFDEIAPTYWRANCNCSLTLDCGIQAPTVGSCSSRSAGTPPDDLTFLRPGSLSRSSTSPSCAPVLAASTSGLLLACFAASATRALSSRSRNESFRGPPVAGFVSEVPGRSISASLSARQPPSSAPALRPERACSRKAFFAAVTAFFTFGPSFVSRGANFSCSSFSHTSCETTGCVLTEPPSARSKT